MVKLEGTLEEMIKFVTALKEGVDTTKEIIEQGTTTVKKVKRKLSQWQRFLRDFVFRKQKRSESNAAYLGARTKAASRAYKKMKKGRKKR